MLDRDVSDMIPGVDKLLYAHFIRATACRVGQMLNVHDIAQDVGVSDDNIKISSIIKSHCLHHPHSLVDVSLIVDFVKNR